MKDGLCVLKHAMPVWIQTSYGGSSYNNGRISTTENTKIAIFQKKKKKKTPPSANMMIVVQNEIDICEYSICCLIDSFHHSEYV